MHKVVIILILMCSYALGCQYCDELAAIRNALADGLEDSQSTVSQTAPTQSGLIPRVTRIRARSRFGAPCEKFRKRLEKLEEELKAQKSHRTFRSFSDFLKR